MTGFVLDCSIAVAWCFEDEASEDCDLLLERVRDEGAWVIWQEFSGHKVRPLFDGGP